MSETGRMRIAGVLVGVLVLSGCSSGGSVFVSSSGDATLVASASRPDVQMQALITGELSITEGGCFGIGDSPAVFPIGTALDGEGLEVPGLGHVDLGDTIEGSGGSVPGADRMPAECVGDEVVYLNPWD